MIGWLRELSADVQRMIVAAAGDQPVEAWSTAPRPELGGVSLQQALDEPATAPTALRWLRHQTGKNATPASPSAQQLRR